MTDKLNEDHVVEVLEGVEAIRKRPGLYVGSLDTKSTHIYMEVMDNAIDEANRRSKHIRTTIDNDKGEYSIGDTGGGIPDYDMEDGRNSLDLLFTVLHSSGKFNSDTYKTSGGLHGVGLVCLNAFSSKVVVESMYKGRHSITVFEDGVRTSHTISDDTSIEHGLSTKISWKVSPDYYTDISIDTNSVIAKLDLMGARYDLEITVNNTAFARKSIPQVLRSYICNDVNASKPISFTLFNTTSGTDSLTAHFLYSYTGGFKSDQCILKGDVNNIVCDGKYLDTFRSIIAKAVTQLYRKNHPGSALILTSRDVSPGLRGWVSLTIEDPVFTSQTKETMDKPMGRLNNGLLSQFVALFEDDASYKKMYDKMISTKLSKKVVNNSRVSLDSPLLDCTNRNKNILYICEGKSAKSALKEIRNRSTEAIFPLMGKIMNVIGKDRTVVSKSVKLATLAEAMGINIIHPELTQLRYDQFKILCDADVDGYHIYTLLITFIINYAPEIIKEGRLIIMITPLWAIRNADNTIDPLYTKLSIDDARSKGKSIVRFKGIGEYNPDQVEPLIHGNRCEYTVTWPAEQAAVELTTKLMSNTAIKMQVRGDMTICAQLLNDRSVVYKDGVAVSNGVGDNSKI